MFEAEKSKNSNDRERGRKKREESERGMEQEKEVKEGERERERCQMHLWFCVSTFCFVRTLGVSILQSVINLKKKMAKKQNLNLHFSSSEYIEKRQ
jgi:hypothetical protein